MAAAITINSVTNSGPGVDETMNQTIVDFTVALTGSYTSGGDTLSFASQDLIKTSQLTPNLVELYEWTPAGTTPTGYVFQFQPGTTLANGVVYIWTAAGSTQFSGAYSALPTGFVLRGRAYFSRV
jgi:hypothetical protein